MAPDLPSPAIDPAPLLKIFVVDDERIIASTLALILNRQGYDSRAFYEPREALEAARSDPPDMLISDVMMPGMTGIALAIQIRELCPDCKVLLFSGQAATGDLLKAANLGDHNFELLTKPVHPTDLLAAVKQTEVTREKRRYRMNMAKFAHRPRADGSTDSICLTCYRTIATTTEVSVLQDLEAKHKCGGMSLARLLHPESQLP